METRSGCPVAGADAFTDTASNDSGVTEVCAEARMAVAVAANAKRNTLAPLLGFTIYPPIHDVTWPFIHPPAGPASFECEP